MPLYSAFCTLDGLNTSDPLKLAQEIRRLESQGIVTGMDPNRFLGKANSFILPRGFEAGRGWAIVTGDRASTLNQDVATHTLRFKGDGDITFRKLTVVGCEALTGTDVYSDTSLYLVELADLRHFGQYTSINKAYNVLVPDESDVYDATQNSGSDWTYTTMVQDIWTFMPGAFGSLNVSDVSFSGTPRNYVFRGVTAWDALKKVLDDQQHELVLSVDGEFSVVPAFTATGDFSDERDTHKAFILSGSHDLDTPFSRVPATIRVFFPRRDKAWQNNTDLKVVVYKDHWQLNPLYSVDVAASSIDGDLSTLAGTVLPVHSPEPALYSELGVISNAAALSTQATNIATRVVNARKIADENALYRYSGARSFTLGAEVSCLSVQDTGNGVITEVRGYTRSRRSSTRLDRQQVTPAGDLPFFSRESNSPPDLPRWAMETERWVIADIYGGSLEPNGSAQARVQFGTNGSGITWADSGSSHVITVYDVLGLTVAEGERVFAIFHQQTERWLVWRSGATQVVRFRLTEPLKIGEDAEAVIRTLDGTGYINGSAIRVFDWWGISQGNRGMWSGDTDMEGWAVIREDQSRVTEDEPEPQYDIVWMEQFGRFSQVTLTTRFAGDDATAGSQPDYTFGQGLAPPSDSNGELPVHDDQRMFPRAKADAKACVVRNEYLDTDHPDSPWYTVFNCQQEAIYGEATLAGPMCPDASSGALQDFIPRSPSLYNLMPDPEPTIARNIWHLAGRSGDKVLVFWFDATQEEKDQDPNTPGWWVIAQVTHHEYKHYTDWQWNDVDKCIQYKFLQRTAIMTCSEESDWTDLLCFEECPAPA